MKRQQYYMGVKLSNSGFSLVEILIAMGLVAVASASIMTMLTNSMKATSFSEARVDQIEMVRQLQMTLSDKPSCESSFKNLVLGTAAVTVTQVVDRNGVPVLKLNDLIGNRSLIVKSMRLGNKNVPVGGGLGDAELIIQTERVKSTVGSKESTSKISIKVTADASGAITGCFSSVDDTAQSTLKLSCTQLGGVFDTTTNQCNLSSDCSKIADNQPMSGKCVKEMIAAAAAAASTPVNIASDVASAGGTAAGSGVVASTGGAVINSVTGTTGAGVTTVTDATGTTTTSAVAGATGGASSSGGAPVSSGTSSSASSGPGGGTASSGTWGTVGAMTGGLAPSAP